MDPVTISLSVGVASKASSAIKQGFAIGRDIEQMSGDKMDADVVQFATLIACIAALSGGIHGWMLRRWFMKSDLGGSGTGNR